MLPTTTDTFERQITKTLPKQPSLSGRLSQTHEFFKKQLPISSLTNTKKKKKHQSGQILSSWVIFRCLSTAPTRRDPSIQKNMNYSHAKKDHFLFLQTNGKSSESSICTHSFNSPKPHSFFHFTHASYQNQSAAVAKTVLVIAGGIEPLRRNTLEAPTANVEHTSIRTTQILPIRVLQKWSRINAHSIRNRLCCFRKPWLRLLLEFSSVGLSPYGCGS